MGASAAPTLSGMTEDERRERAALLALLRLASSRRKTWAAVVGEVLDADSAITVLDRLAPPATLLDGEEHGAALQEAADILAEWESDGVELVTVLDDHYPRQLREIHEVPPLLFYRGDLRRRDSGVSIVGSRRASERGLTMAHSVATHLVAEGLTVIAGLAAGIDTAAHRAALASGGRTVGIIGTGIRRSFPPENEGLQEQIARDGLLLSQFYPDAPPSKTSFPIRNATMSGYGVATVVVEATERSGARIQARLAVEHGRPVILSDLVVERTEWATKLRDRPGVYVASSVTEVMDRVHEIGEQTAALRDVLAHRTG